MLETLVGAALMCGSLSVVIILFTKFFMRSESYDEMLAKRKKQENEFLTPKPAKKEKTKNQKSKVKKIKSSEDVIKPKAEVKPMVIEEEIVADEEESDIVEEVAAGVEAQREPVTSRRSKKKGRKWKNVSFSDDGEPMNEQEEFEEVKPILVNKDERSPIRPTLDPPVHVRPPGKDSLELKHEHDGTNGAENGTGKKKKKKSRKVAEEEVIEKVSLQQTASQPPSQQHPQQQVHALHLQVQPKSLETVVDGVEKNTTSLTNTEGASKKKKKADRRSEPVTPGKPVKDVKDVNGVGEEAQTLIGVIDLTPMSRVELKALASTLVEKGGPGLIEPDEMTMSEMRGLRATEAVLRKELLSERANLASMTNSAKERMTALNAKIMELQQELNRSKSLTQDARQMREENDRLKASLKEMENHTKIITDQFAVNAKQLDTAERAKKTLEVQVDRLREQLKSYEKRMHEGTAHMDGQLAAAKSACAGAEREARDSRRELEAVNTALTFERSSAQERVSALEREMAALQLALQGAKAERRGAAEGQEDPVQRSAAAAAAAAAAATAAGSPPRSEQLEKALKEKDGKITDLESEVQRLNQQIDNQRHKNNQLETRLTASSERLEVAQKEVEIVPQLTLSVRNKEHEVAMLKHELEELRAEQTRQKAASVDDSAVLTCLQAQVDGLRRENELLKNTSLSGDSEKWQAEIDALRSKNNELREKNWKTVEALNAAQTESDRRVKDAEEAGRGEVRDLKAAMRRLESEATANQGWRSMAEQAEAAKREAEEQLAHYKSALVETETILRDLEKSVETEEKKWQATLQESEQECERARKELANAYSELKRTGASREVAS